MRSSDVRQSFLDFFGERGHEIVPSSPIVLRDDPTLLFVNAGMNQFKDVFLGTGRRGYTRAADTQKCIRAGGKHNDLEDVGRDTYHHTFFEMLGNWSFGDYFKREAIEWAWQLLAEVWGLDVRRLHVTYFEGDPGAGLDADIEARDLWLRFLPADRVHPGSSGDNFWEMADTGPCGPCSEVHYDATPDFSGGGRVNADDPLVIEFWNLVFIQFNREDDGGLSPLPARHVDTGMGFERIVRILQDRSSNYDTDIFTPLFDAIREVTGAPAYGCELHDPADVAYRVVADHIRTLAFAIADGVLPSNEGRGYVLRRVLRRASRFARRLGTHEPMLWRLVEGLSASMGQVFPELRSHREGIERVIRAEEENFGQTLDRGIELFEQVAGRIAGRGDTAFPGEEAFRLYDTFGFPVDLTALMARERGLAIDLDRFETLMEEQRTRARSARRGEGDRAAAVEALRELASTGIETPFLGYETLRSESKVEYIVRLDGVAADRLAEGEEAHVVLDATPFYAEAGGQVADIGAIVSEAGVAEVVDTQKYGDGMIAHRVRVKRGRILRGDRVQAAVDEGRRIATARHHTSTHLLQNALRTVLGPSVRQAGSYVGPDRLRFDFTWYSAVTPEQLEEVERIVNGHVVADDAVSTSEIAYAEVEGADIIAVFDERYGDRVRVIDIGGYSRELCGGTHLRRTGQAGQFLILSESAIAAGVRRIEAVSGMQAVGQIQKERRVLRRTGDVLSAGPDEIEERVQKLLREVRDQEKQLRRLSEKGAAGEVDGLLARPHSVRELDVYTSDLGERDAAYLRSVADAVRSREFSGVLILGARCEGKAVLLCAASKDAVGRGAHAGKIVSALARRVGGGGGGRPDLAQAGGRDANALAAALAESGAIVEQTLA